MKEIITYVADDGTEFDTEVECLEYENRFAAVKQIKMFDLQMRKLDTTSLYTALETVAYAIFDNKHEFDCFNETCEYYGFAKIPFEPDFFKGSVIAGFDVFSHSWENLSERLEYLEAIVERIHEACDE